MCDMLVSRTQFVHRIVRHLTDTVKPRRITDDSVMGRLVIPPVFGTHTFEGINLSEFITPIGGMPIESCEGVFSRLVFKLKMPAAMRGERAWVDGPNRVSRFVGRSPEALVIWAGRQAGCDLQAKGDTLLCTLPTGNSFGIDRGHWKFNDVEYLEGDTKHYINWGALSTPGEVGTHDPVFRAYAAGAKTDRDRMLVGILALANLGAGHALFPKPVKQADIKKIFTAFAVNKHTIYTIHRVLVPEYISETEFRRMFGHPSTWKERMSEKVLKRRYKMLCERGLLKGCYYE